MDMKRALSVGKILLTISLLFAAPLFAQEDKEFGEAMSSWKNDAIFSGQVSSAKGLEWPMIYSTCIIGNNPVACSDNPNDWQGYMQNSAMGGLTQGIALLYEQKPANTTQYLAYMGEKMALVKPANAQGIGISGLSPILPLWSAFRYVAYGFMAIMMTAIGFMVFFRMKIDPRTVISVQTAIPRIVVTLLLITFSYAIAGLMVDFMYLVMFSIFWIFSSAFPAINLSEVMSYYTGTNVTSLFNAVFTPGLAAVDDLINLIGRTNAQFISTAVGAILGGLLVRGGSIPRILVGAGTIYLGSTPAGPNILVGFIVGIALLIALIRIFAMLIAAYIQIIISVIFAPLQLMVGAIPNVDAFGNWIRNLTANMAVFPITMTMLLLGTILTNQAVDANSVLWVPPGLGGGNYAASTSGIIGLALLLIIPNIANSFKEAIKAKPAVPVGLSTIVSPLLSPLQSAWNIYYQFAALRSFQRGGTPIIPPPVGGGGGGGGGRGGQ